MALGLPIRSISYVPFPEHCTRVQIKGNEALEILEKAVIQQKILFRNRCCVAGRGIPQGSTVSTRLCDLYLGAMERERYADILKRRDCLLFRYVDDYILLTTDVRLADRFLKDLLCGVEDGYEMVADASRTTINFVTDLHEFNLCVNVIGDDGFVTWCGYRIYPRELRVSIDETKFCSKQRFSPCVKETSGAHAKRLAILAYAKGLLRRKLRVLCTSMNGKWRLMAVRKLVRLGISWYIRPYIKKIMLNPKAGANRVFMRRLPAWVSQGFSYRYNSRISRLFGL